MSEVNEKELSLVPAPVSKRLFAFVIDAAILSALLNVLGLVFIAVAFFYFGNSILHPQGAALREQFEW